MITGASGVLGSALTKALLDRNYHVLAVTSRVSTMKHLGLLEVSWDELFSGSVSAENISMIVHCAFARSQIGEDLAHSVCLSEKLFSWARDNFIPSVINISSQSVYGNFRAIPATEYSKIDPTDKYAVAKFSCERIANIVMKGTKTKFSNIRLASLIGPEFEERIVFKMLNSALSTGRISVIGGKQIYSFLDIRDAVSGILAMILSTNCDWKPVYNLGTNEIYSIIDLAETIKEVIFMCTGKSVTISTDYKDINYKAILDSRLFNSQFNFSVEYDLKSSVEYILKRKFKNESFSLCDLPNL